MKTLLDITPDEFVDMYRQAQLKPTMHNMVPSVEWPKCCALGALLMSHGVDLFNADVYRESNNVFFEQLRKEHDIDVGDYMQFAFGFDWGFDDRFETDPTKAQSRGALFLHGALVGRRIRAAVGTGEL